MKRSTLTIFNLLLLFSVAMSQSITSGAYFEKTVLNAQVGISSGMVVHSNWEMGGFYQREVSGQQYHETISHPVIEETYVGFYVQHPIYYYQGCPLNLNIRAGIVNGDKIVIAPSLRYEVVLGKRLIADAGLGGAGIGSGNFRPTMFFGLKLRQ